MPYEKDRNSWNEFSKKLEAVEPPYFKEREVWWTSIGVNIGHEEDGKGPALSRPVLILKKFGKYTFLGIPLSTTKRVGALYRHFSFLPEVDSVALLAHTKSFDSRRLIKKIGTIADKDFCAMRKAVKDLL
ncbi:type II toxin-antitoxin system PemK/MazF family toxin [Patescibacteria group bacterium]|nr:type II toxin-antitoxin system PemK/MazF family toxin [Patescibacteria group bacterium]MDE1946400.1 type II toxin-antitoxin system PemK/MazF family toxin [Patescibacteria group bacterium]MDE2011009.1 type II toxin-antitoxin system PemK/MazF family toxin [Patescibacteria group bacterium]MDE2233032.1 type II toxin-antitoxin system PemK/MazF family toxin [Patescibacteria group bacterium]